MLSDSNAERGVAGGPNFYKVASISETGKRSAVRRRFNDLFSLHETLKTSFRGCVIPFRPGKTFANSSVIRNHKDTFLKDRAYAIKCYLVKITHHPEIKESPVRFRPVFHAATFSVQPYTVRKPHAVCTLYVRVWLDRALLGRVPEAMCPVTLCSRRRYGSSWSRRRCCGTA